MIRTKRLQLIPFTLEHMEAAIEGRKALEKLLHSNVPEQWPSRGYAKALPIKKEKLLQQPRMAQWSRIAVERNENIVIGEIGCKDGPDANGTVELGYGIIPDYRNKGYATEMVKGLTTWLLQQQQVTKVAASCLEINQPSVRVLEKVGFQQTAVESGVVYWSARPALKC